MVTKTSQLRACRRSSVLHVYCMCTACVLHVYCMCTAYRHCMPCGSASCAHTPRRRAHTHHSRPNIGIYVICTRAGRQPTCTCTCTCHAQHTCYMHMHMHMCILSSCYMHMHMHMCILSYAYAYAYLADRADCVPQRPWRAADARGGRHVASSA